MDMDNDNCNEDGSSVDVDYDSHSTMHYQNNTNIKVVKTESFYSSDSMPMPSRGNSEVDLDDDRDHVYDTVAETKTTTVKIEPFDVDLAEPEPRNQIPISGSCVNCGKVFRLRSSWLAHKFKCTKNPGQKPYNNRKCKYFLRDRELKDKKIGFGKFVSVHNPQPGKCPEKHILKKSKKTKPKNHQNPLELEMEKKCLHCGHEFKQRGNLKTHLNAMLPKQNGHKFKCGRCNGIFEAKCTFKKHEKNQRCSGTCIEIDNDGTATVTNKSNSETTNTNADLVENSTISIEAKIAKIIPLRANFDYSCPYCDKKCQSKFKLERHLIFVLPKIQGQLNFPCVGCNKIFEARCAIYAHQNPQKCPNCTYETVCEDVFQKHVESCCKSNPSQKLPVINRSIEPLIFAKNIPKPKPQTKKVNSSLSFSCPHCQRTFTKKFSLQRHLNLNLRVRPGSLELQCLNCNQKFAFKCQKSLHTCNNEDEDPLSTTENETEVLQQIQIESDPLSTTTTESIIIIKPSTSASKPIIKIVPFISIPIIQSTATPSPSEDNTVKIQHPEPALEPSIGIANAGPCVSCGKVFRFRSSLLAHKFKCTKNRVRGSAYIKTNAKPLQYFQCDQSPCTSLFNTKQGLNVHRTVAHKSQNKAQAQHVQCTVCHKLFADRIELNQHFRRTHCRNPKISTSYSCPHCKANFIEESQLNRHLQLNNKQITSNYCPYCNQEFYYKCTYQKHIVSCDKNPGIACRHCGKKFKTLENTKAHIRRFCIDRKLKTKYCTYCHVNFHTTASLTKHLKNTRTSLDCKQCGQVYLYPCQTRWHTRQQFCAQCKLMFKCQVIYLAHISDGGGCEGQNKSVQEGQYPCFKCSKIFKTAHSLNKHWAFCFITRKYKCDFELCGKKFPSLGSLNQHRDEHLLKPCTHCGHKFSQKSRLNIHLEKMLPKEEGQKFKCDRCNKVFESKCLFRKHCEIEKCGGTCVDHYEIDTGQSQLRKPEPVISKSVAVAVPNNSKTCTHCEHEFSEISSLIKHLKRMLPKQKGQKFICDTCEKDFESRCLFKRHKQIKKCGRSCVEVDSCNSVSADTGQTQTEKHPSSSSASDPVSTADSVTKIEPASTSASSPPSQIDQDEDSGGPFHCWACEISFDRKIQFFNHVRTIHNEEPE